MPRRPSVRLGACLLALLVGGCGSAAPSSTPAGTTGVTAAPPTAAPPSSSPSTTPASSSSTAPAIEPTVTPAPLAGIDALMAATIAADRPMLRFDLQPDRLDGSWILDGNADDGLGPGRLYVVVTPRPGDLTAHPCGDPDFRQGGVCVEQVLPNGDRVVLRDRVTSHGVTTVLAVLIHPDRSGITAEASNVEIPIPPPAITGNQRRSVVVSRPDPLYTARELSALVQAIDVALRTGRVLPSN